MPPSGEPTIDRPTAGRRWAQFLAGLLVILLFAFGAISQIQRLGPVREVRDAAGNAGIDATAPFYSESEVSSEAEASIRNAIRFSTRRAGCPAAVSPRAEIHQSSAPR